MVDSGGVLVGLIFVAAVTGLILINDLDKTESYQSITNSEISKSSQISEDKIIRALNDMDTKLVSLFNDLREELVILNNRV